MAVSTTELVDRIFLFCEAYAYGQSGHHFFPYQAQFAKRIIRSLLENDGEEISALFSRQSGKSETVSIIAGGCAVILPILANLPMFLEDKRLSPYKNGLLIGIFAPALHQAQISFTRLKGYMATDSAEAIFSDPEINVVFDTNNGQNIVIRLANLNVSSVITCMSASEGSNIEGKSYMLIIVDEAQDVSNHKYLKSISPMGAFYNATKILIGTPTTQKGFFFEAIERNKQDYLKGERKRNHFEYNYEYVCKYNPNYMKYIAGEKRRLGADSDEFQMSYNLKWLFERGMFVNPTKFEALGVKNMGRILCDYSKDHVVGIDCGKKTDSTIVTVGAVDWDNPIIVEQSPDPNVPDFVIYDTTIVDWLELQGDNWDEQYYQVMSYLNNFKVSKIVIDATGVGSPIADRLAANVGCEVVPYVFSSTAKSDLYKHYDMLIKQGRLHFPANPEAMESREYQRFINQHFDLQKSYSGQNMVCAHPDEKGAHDDYPDSSALMCWGAKGEVSKPEGTSVNPFLGKLASSYYKSRNRVTARRSR